MRGVICFLLFLFSIMVCRAEQVGMPCWVYTLPKSAGKKYYYRVTSAEAGTYAQAYSRAFAMAILESSWKLGVAVNKGDDIEVIEGDIARNLDIKSVNVKLPLNKACEYVERVATSNKIRIYILWQVGRYGNVDPEFEDFTDCY